MQTELTDNLHRLLAREIKVDADDYPRQITDTLIMIGKGIAWSEEFELEAKRLAQKIDWELSRWRRKYDES